MKITTNDQAPNLIEWSIPALDSGSIFFTLVAFWPIKSPSFRKAKIAPKQKRNAKMYPIDSSKIQPPSPMRGRWWDLRWTTLNIVSADWLLSFTSGIATKRLMRWAIRERYVHLWQMSTIGGYLKILLSSLFTWPWRRTFKLWKS